MERLTATFRTPDAGDAIRALIRWDALLLLDEVVIERTEPARVRVTWDQYSDWYKDAADLYQHVLATWERNHGAATARTEMQFRVTVLHLDDNEGNDDD